MSDCWATDLSWSSKLFLSQVWPMCSAYCGGGEIMQMEGHTDSQLKLLLDQRAGIDGWHIHNNGMRGIAARIQLRVNYKTFTIRMSRDSGAETEYAKRLFAIESNDGWLYPVLTIHAYAETETGPILSVGVAKTSDIISYIQAGRHYERRTTNATFAVCDWHKMKGEGLDVNIITGDTQLTCDPWATEESTLNELFPPEAH